MRNASWTNWVNGILGIWVIISPYVFTGNALKIDLWITGIIIIILSFAGGSYMMPPTDNRP